MNNKVRNLLNAVTILLAVLSLTVTAGPVAAQGGWSAEYFANRDLAGAPVVVRLEDRLHFEWGAGGPGPGVPSDNFSARWTRDEWFEGGSYRFSYRSDDGIRIWVGEALVVDEWRDREAGWSQVERFVTRGTHGVRVEYYEHVGGAALQVGWERVSHRAGWRGEYFANRSLSDAPTLVRYDPAIDFDWKDRSPDPSIPADDFSVRWSRTVTFDAGAYRFYTSSDDGVRIYVNGHRVVDAWEGAQNTRWGDVTLSSGQHTIVVEYYERGKVANAHVWWDRLDTLAGWKGRYYDNTGLRGGPVLIRDDADINFDWGEGAPVAGMPNDNFSVLWERQVNFAPGYYRLNVHSDDGVRVWLDGGLIMDYWRSMDNEWHYADGMYLEGVHTFKVGYFEGGGGARIRFWWEPSSTKPSPTSPEPGPAPVSPATSSPRLPGPWSGEYFNGADLSGSPALARTDASLDFNWGWSGPTPEMNRDGFSARWRGTFSFEGGRYVFTTYSDDGVRLYVDDRLVIDSWRPMRGYRSATLDLDAGLHTVRLEYFERAGVALVRCWWERSARSATVPAPVPVPALVACPGGPLWLDAWPVDRVCIPGGGWAATIFVEGHGGDCQYTYAWERQVQGGPVAGSAILEVRGRRGSAIVGEASVASGGQTAVVGLLVRAPRCR